MEYLLLKNVDFDSNVKNRVFATFLVKDCNVSQSSDGKTYISMTMKHLDLEINLKLFNASQLDIDTIKPGIVLNSSIDVKPYAKSPTGWGCVLYKYEVNTTTNPSIFIEWAEGMKEANEVITRAIKVICESSYKDIVYPLLVDKWNEFYVWTAAKSQHHNILGGLMVHTAEVIEQCEILADYWNKKNGESFINKQLLISAALLHDLCKIEELSVDTASGNTDYSSHGALSTHILDICCKVEVQACKVKFGEQVLDDNGVGIKTCEQIEREKEQVLLLKHCLASHHGKLEYGSCIIPHVPEAEILHSMDEMSAVMYKYNKRFKALKGGEHASNWLPNGLDVTYKESTKI